MATSDQPSFADLVKFLEVEVDQARRLNMLMRLESNARRLFGLQSLLIMAPVLAPAQREQVLGEVASIFGERGQILGLTEAETGELAAHWRATIEGVVATVERELKGARSDH